MEEYARSALLLTVKDVMRELTATYSTDLCDTYASNAEWQVCGA